LVIVFSLAFALVPTKVEAAPCQWTPETLPGMAGRVVLQPCDVSALAVANDGATIWAASDNGNAGLYFSTNGGMMFNPTPANPVTGSAFAANRVITHIDIAPDNPSVVIVSDNFSTVWFTTNGGISWASLGKPSDGIVTDVAASPAMAGSILGRYYFATTADNTTTAVTTGGVWELGTPAAGATWRGWNAGALTNRYDFMALEVTPGFVGDQSICVVGATDNTQVDFMVLNVNTNTVTDNVTIVTGTTHDYVFPLAAGTNIASADIALPMDFDATTIANIRAYVGVGTNTAQATDDVYRIDGRAFRRLNAVTTIAVNTVSFSGVINGGTLFLGEWANSNVRYSTDPTSGAPTWINSAKSPTGGNGAWAVNRGLTIVRVAPDFATSNKVYAGTSGVESAFSRSLNGGKSFNQKALIDTRIHAISDVMPTPDGKTIYVSTSDNGTDMTTGTTSDFESLWKSSIPTGAPTWERIRLSIVAGVPANWGNASGDTIIRLNPDWATTPRLYWSQRGGAGNTNIQTSSDGGDTYSNRICPAGTTIQDLAVEDGSILYVGANGSAFVYRSTNAAYTWGPPVDGQGGNVNTLAMAPSYPYKPVAGNVLVGGTGAVGVSTNGGTSFARYNAGFPGTVNTLQVLADQNYATNNTIYAGDTGGTSNGTFRLVPAAGANWANMITGSVGVVAGLGMENGAFYSLTPISGAFRTLAPLNAPGTIPWDTCWIGTVPPAAPAPSGLRVAGGTLYVVDSTAFANRLLSYGDSHQTGKTTVSSPAGGATVPLDPVNGRALPVTVKWSSLGVSTGLATAYNVAIYEKATGFTGSAIIAGVPIGPAVTAPTVRICDPTLATGNDIAYTLIAGREYGVQIMATVEVSGDNITSPWSDPVFFKVEEGVPQTEMTPPLTVPPITIPPITIPPVTVPPAQVISPAWIWAVVIIGAILVIAVIVLIFMTRRP